jgi:hypothetical protein
MEQVSPIPLVYQSSKKIPSGDKPGGKVIISNLRRKIDSLSSLAKNYGAWPS